MFRTWLTSFGIILIAFFTPIGHTQDSCTPQSDQCTFYRDCLETKIPCGARGYAIGYGLKYCSAFMKHFLSFSDVGQHWVTATCLCLQNALLPIVNGNGPQTCDAIKNFAVSSHVACYTDTKPSVCDIPKSDWYTVLVVIGKELINPETWRTVKEVAEKCNKNNILVKNNVIM